MALSAEAKAANLEKSLTVWLQEHLVTTAGLSVFYGNSPIAARPNEWVHVDYLLGVRRTFGRQIGRTHLGNRVHGFLNLNLCKKRDSITNLYALAVLRDVVMTSVHVSQVIPIQDYETVGTPTIGYFMVDGVTEADPDDGLMSGVMVKALSIALQHVEGYTLV